MPSVADVQQQTTKLSLNSNNGKSTPTIQQQQQQSNSTSSGNQIDTTNVDPITQAILLLEKKQRNLGKRKEKLESYQQIAKSGKELNKDQTEALAKYGDVVGQIECVKDIYEQVKKIQTDSAKSQKRLLKQAAEEKRLFATQRLREYVQLRYLIDHQPSSLKAEESKLFDELVPVVVPSDNSLNTINRAVETVLAIYQGGPASTTIKNLTGRTSQEVRETLEQLIQSSQLPTTTSNNQPIQQQQPEIDNTNDVVVPSINETQQLVQTNSTEYPLTFDTRNQNIPLQQIIQDNTFFPVDILTTNNTQNQQESTTNQDNQTNDHKQFVQTQSISQQQNYDQENSANLVHDDQQHTEDQWQQRRSNNATGGHRGGNYNGSANRNYNRGGGAAQNNYNQQQQQQQHWRGGPQRGGPHYDNSYNAGQRQYHENSNRGGPNPNYRGNRGGNNYRGGNRGGNAGYNGNGYQKTNQYQQNNEQQQQHQVRSAPSNKQQQ